jgi:inorganic pyrophosphatase
LSILQDKHIGDHYSVACGVPEIVDLTSEIKEQSSAKWKADAKLTAIDEAKKPKHGSPAANILVEKYWDSPGAKKPFLGNSNDERDVVDILQQRIKRLQEVNRSPYGWRDLVDKHDVDNLCSPYDIFII